jgi:predicted RNA binding protein YcfA (HicA-like mRNA interferase family)
MSPREADRLLVGAGYVAERFGKGGHRIYRKAGVPGIFTISWHNHSRDLPVSQMCEVLKGVRRAGK